MNSPDIERLKALMARLEEITREAAQIRERITAIAQEQRVWPHDRAASQASTDRTSPSEIPPRRSRE